MISEQFVILALLLILFGDGSYIVDTFKGRTQPNRVTWVLWATFAGLGLVGQLDEGVGAQALLTVAVGLGPILIVLASFFNNKAYWKLGRLDYFFGAWAVAGVIAWQIIGEGEVALVFAIVGELLAAIPTAVKSWKAPETETPITYGMCALASIITLLTIDTWEFAEYGYPLYLALICAGFYGLIFAAKRRDKVA